MFGWWRERRRRSAVIVGLEHDNGDLRERVGMLESVVADLVTIIEADHAEAQSRGQAAFVAIDRIRDGWPPAAREEPDPDCPF